MATPFRGLLPDLNFVQSAGALKSKIEFNGVGGLLTHICFTQGGDDMSDHDEWISYSHWGMFLTRRKSRNNTLR
jgi:hypothetical protein